MFFRSNPDLLTKITHCNALQCYARESKTCAIVKKIGECGRDYRDSTGSIAGASRKQG
jgi:hypothetical protein